MQQVHRKKGTNGYPVYDRINDDMTASFEDMMAMLHGQPIANIKNKTTLRRRYSPREMVTPVRV